MTAPVRWRIGALAVAMIVVGLTGGGCARNGLGGYELPKIWRAQ